MRKKTYDIQQDLVKTHFSFAKFFFVIAGAILLFSGFAYLYVNFVRTEPLEFYKDIENCTVVTDYEISRSYGSSDRTYTTYYVYVYTPEGEKNVKMSVSRSYYDNMSAYNQRTGVKLSFFKTKKGSLFPAYSFGCSEKTAGHQYVECYPPTVLNTIIAVAACVGGACLIVGLFAWRTARNRDEELAVEVAQTGIEESHEDEFLKEFDEAMQRDPRRLTRSPASSRGNVADKGGKRISASERDELLKEFDKLTADGKYKYKMHE